MSEFKMFALIIVSVIVGVIGLVALITLFPTNSDDVFKDAGIVCVTTKPWGFMESKHACYQMTPVK